MHVSYTLLAKARGIKYFNVETWMCFAPLSKFLATRLVLANCFLYKSINFLCSGLRMKRWEAFVTIVFFT